MKDVFQAAAHSARLLAGRRFYLLALVPLAWPAFLALLLLNNRDMETFRSASAQGTLIGLPLTVLAIFLGVRVIAGELDARRLELVYTVPGGARRVWWSKLLAALYGALQAAVFYLLLAMGMAVLFKSEVTGAMAAAGRHQMWCQARLPDGTSSRRAFDRGPLTRREPVHELGAS